MINYKDYCSLELKEGIVFARYVKNAHVDVEIGKSIVEARLELTNRLPHAVLICGGPITMSKEARSYALRDEALDLIKATAIVADENLLKITFYKLLFFTQSRKRRMRFFSNMEHGINWLKESAAVEIEQLHRVQELN